MKLLLSLAVALVPTVITTAFTLVAPNTRQQQTRTSSSSLQAATQLLDRTTGKSQLDPAVIDRYQNLPYPAETVLAEYVWVDAVGNARSKTRTLPSQKVRLSVGHLLRSFLCRRSSLSLNAPLVLRSWVECALSVGNPHRHYHATHPLVYYFLLLYHNPQPATTTVLLLSSRPNRSIRCPNGTLTARRRGKRRVTIPK
jgi:hypothetical protein